MDADATAALHKRGVAATDDSFKFIWCQVRYFIYLHSDCYSMFTL